MSWQAAIPLTIAVVGMFHFFLAQHFSESEYAEKITPIIFSWYGFGFIFIIDSLFAIHLFALNPATPTSMITATRVSYIVGIGSFGWTFLYFIIKGIQYSAEEAVKTGRKWGR